MARACSVTITEANPSGTVSLVVGSGTVTFAGTTTGTVTGVIQATGTINGGAVITGTVREVCDVAPLPLTNAWATETAGRWKTETDGDWLLEA